MARGATTRPVAVVADRVTIDGLAWMAEHMADHQVALQLGRLDYEGRGVSPTAPHPELTDESARWALRITGTTLTVERPARGWPATASTYVRVLSRLGGRGQGFPVLRGSTTPRSPL